MTRNGYDIPGHGAVVIGGDHITGTLHKYEDGSQQGPAFVGDTDEEVREQAGAWFLASGGKTLYPDGLELRLRP